MDITNREFLYTIFGAAADRAHVTAFVDDPSAIAVDRRAACWAGTHAKKIVDIFKEDENQYYTISVFSDEDGRAVRRIPNFEACYIIVADDVKEKLDVEKMSMLPDPTYKLLTSAGSEQWGWVLDRPCYNAHKVNLLVDGIIAISSEKKIDPGMKGITRYVRLPGGSNTKKSRCENGNGFKCKLLEWKPGNFAEIQELADSFDIDLTTNEKSKALLPPLPTEESLSHPIFKHTKRQGKGNNGWERIECLNADKHSGGDRTGAAVKVNINGELLYQCHHGHCQGEQDDFGKTINKVTGNVAIKIIDEKNFEGKGVFTKECADYKKKISYKYDKQLASLEQKEAQKRRVSAEKERKNKVNEAEKAAIFEEVEKKTREIEQKTIDGGMFDPLRYIYLFNNNKFYDIKTGLVVIKDSLDSRYCQQFPSEKKRESCSATFLRTLDHKISDAEGLIWKPTNIKKPERKKLISKHQGKKVVNTWRGIEMQQKKGDISLWLEHAKLLIPNEKDRDVVLDYLACLLQRIGEKPQFAIIHTGAPGVGKDMLYDPIVRILDSSAGVVSIDKAIDGWGDYLKELKLVVIPEVDKGKDKVVANALKTLTATVAGGYETLNLKGGVVLNQYDCKGVILLSNRKNAIAIEEKDRRYYAVESYIEKKPAAYFNELSDFYKKGGVEMIFNYLMKRDIAKFNHNCLPGLTTAARGMMQSGLYDYEQDIQEMVEGAMSPFDMRVITAFDVKRDLKALKIVCGNNGLQNALDRVGFMSMRGVFKTEGKTCSTPTFFAEKNHVEQTFDKPFLQIKSKEIKEYYELFVNKSRVHSSDKRKAQVVMFPD